MAHRLVFHPAIPDDLADALAFYDQISFASATASERASNDV